MKRFLLKIGCFFLIVIIIDCLSGKVFAYLNMKAIGGNNGRNNYICNKTHEDILIMGSSRATKHYNPIIISDSLGLSCYNCGQEGNGIILNYGRYQLISQRYHPHLIIYDVNINYDLLVGEDNHRYLGWLRPYYGRHGIPEIFESVDILEKYKMKSKMYQYNSKYLGIIADFFRPVSTAGVNGFRPDNVEMDTLKVSRKNSDIEPVYDTLKLHYIEKMFDESCGTKFVFVVSPYWNGLDTTSLQPIKKICHEKVIPFFDFSNDPKYVHNNSLFMDGVHMNARGADVFSSDLARRLKKEKYIFNE